MASVGLAAVVAGGYLGLMPLVSSSVTAPQWPSPLEGVSARTFVRAEVGPASADRPKVAAPDTGTLVRVSPTSGDTVKVPRPAIRKAPRRSERRTLARYTQPAPAPTPAAAVDASPAAPEPAPAARPTAPVRRVAAPPAARRPSARPEAETAPARRAEPAPQPEAEIVPIDVPALAGGESSPALDDDPGVASSGG